MSLTRLCACLRFQTPNARSGDERVEEPEPGEAATCHDEGCGGQKTDPAKDFPLARLLPGERRDSRKRAAVFETSDLEMAWWRGMLEGNTEETSWGAQGPWYRPMLQASDAAEILEVLSFTKSFVPRDVRLETDLGPLGCGGIGALEHLAEPSDPESASIWRLPIINMIRLLPGIDFLTLAQGLLGAASPKPTGLMTLGLPSLPRQLVNWAVCKDLPRSRSIGTDGSGHYKTAGLKEYPPAFCAALASSFAMALSSSPPENSAASVPADFVQRCASMLCTDFGQHYGPDWAW
eukprot:s305_g12.t1